jgi:hypothetical protein
MMSEEDTLREKKLRGSGGFVYAKVTDDEQKKGNLGGPELFLAGIGRLPEKDFQNISVINAKKSTEVLPYLNMKIQMKIWEKESFWQKRVSIGVQHAIILSLNIENSTHHQFPHMEQQVRDLPSLLIVMLKKLWLEVKGVK